MSFDRAILLAAFLLLFTKAEGQINVYMGGNLHGNYSWAKGEESLFKPGFGGGFSFVYWEYEYWFLKAGLDYNYKSSSLLDYPYNFVDAESLGPDDQLRIEEFEHSIGIPLTVYFRPVEKGANTLLITGSMEMLYIVHMKEQAEGFDAMVLKDSDGGNRIKTNIGLGVGYQRQLDKHMFLNIVPSFQIDLRGYRAYNSITLTAELLFGVY